MLSIFCTRDCGCIAHPAFPAPSEFQMRFTRCTTRADHAARSRRRGCLHLAPLAERGRRRKASGEGDSRRVRMRGNSPSPRPSPRKRGEGEVERMIPEVWAKSHGVVTTRSWRDEAIRSSSCSIACASNDRFKMHLAVGNYCDSFPRSPDERSDHPGLPSAIQALGAATAPRAPRWRYRQYRCGHRTPLA